MHIIDSIVYVPHTRGKHINSNMSVNTLYYIYYIVVAFTGSVT